MSQTTDFYLSWLGTQGFGGSSIRLRDQEPPIFKPTDISGCAVWMDANDNDAVTYNDLLQVSSWANKGTLGGQFDASGAGIVEYGQVQQNGLNTVSFKEFGFLSGTFNLNFQARSVFVVVKPNSFPLSTAIPIFSSDTNVHQETLFLKNGTWTWFEGKHPSPIPENAFETTTDYTGYASIAELLVASDLSDNWSGINGTYIAPIFQTTASYTTGNAIYYLGNFFGGSPVEADVDYCEIIVYNTALNEPDRINVEDYLRRKWMIVDPPPPPPPAPFVPTDISGLYLWMDASNVSSFVLDASSNILTWSNLGLAGESFNASCNVVDLYTDKDGVNWVNFLAQATLEGTMAFPYKTRTAFAVFKNETPLETITYPYINLLNTGVETARQLGFAYDSNSLTTTMNMCQQGQNCPVNGPILIGTGDTNLAIWASSSNSASNNAGYWNGGSNINTSSDLGNLFSESSNAYSMGSVVADSPAFRTAEILEYDSLLDASQLSTVANYLVTKWAISSFVPLS